MLEIKLGDSEFKKWNEVDFRTINYNEFIEAKITGEFSKQEKHFLNRLYSIDKLTLEKVRLTEMKNINDIIAGLNLFNNVSGTIEEMQIPVEKYEELKENFEIAKQYGLRLNLSWIIGDKDLREKIIKGDESAREYTNKIKEGKIELHVVPGDKELDGWELGYICQQFKNVKVYQHQSATIRDLAADVQLIKNEKVDFSSVRIESIQEYELYEDIIKALQKKNYEMVARIKNPKTIEENELLEFKKRNINKAEIFNSKLGFYEEKSIDELIKNRSTKIIQSVADLDIEGANELKQNGIKYVKIEHYSNKFHQLVYYEIDTYMAIRKKMEELVEGNFDKYSDSRKFRIIYERIAKNISYDERIAKPETPEDEKYGKEQISNCRNLRNGLLEGKCVCAGYADILRNALAMVGIESEYVQGDIVDKEIEADFDIDEYKETEEKQYAYIFEDKEGKRYVGGSHAWVKYKVEGRWYNADPTWDVSYIRRGEEPKWCYKTDGDLEKERKNINGTECDYKISEEEKKIFFRDVEHEYIGNFKIPNKKDIIEIGRKFGKNVGAIARKAKRFLLDEDGIKRLPSSEPTREVRRRNKPKKSWNLSNYTSSKNTNYPREQISSQKRNYRDDDER